MKLPKIIQFTEGLRQTLRRFPLPILCALATTIFLIASWDSSPSDSITLRFVLIGALAFISVLLCDLISESGESRFLGRVIAGILTVSLLVAYGHFLIPDDLDNVRPPLWYIYFTLLFALHLGIALVPLRMSKSPSILWRYNLTLFVRFFFSSLNSALLYGGLALALVSVDKLFGIGFDEDLYVELWFICAFAIHPLLFLSGVPRLQNLQEDAPKQFPKALHFTLRFIGFPLVGLYLLILYAYIIKILVTWSWPNGWVAMPIFILAVVSLLTFVISAPLAKNERWAQLYRNWLFRLLLPLSIVLFLALQVRLADHGVTINRYLGLLLAIWLFGISLAQLLRPRLNLAWMPGSLLLFALFSIYSGPLSAFRWSERSQVERIRELAVSLEIWQDGQLIPAVDPIDSEAIGEFHSSLKYLIKNFGIESLATELPNFQNEATAQKSVYSMTMNVMDFLNLNEAYEQTVNYHTSGVFPAFSEQYQLNFSTFRKDHTSTYDIGGTQLIVNFSSASNRLKISADDGPLTEIDCSDWAKEIIQFVEKDGDVGVRKPAWRTEAAGWTFGFTPQNARVHKGTGKFESISLYIFFSPPEVDQGE